MPLLKEWNPDLYSLAAIWHIAEEEDFFAQQVTVSGEHILHPKRRIEYLAGRFLLRFLNADFPLHAIAPDAQDKPQLPGKEFHFSISHSYPYVACVLSTRAAVGIDVQCWHKGILALQSKFLSAAEQQICQGDPKKICLAWSAKEAAYKYQGLRGVEFIEHLPIRHWQQNEGIFDITINLPLMGDESDLDLKGFIFNDFSLCVGV